MPRPPDLTDPLWPDLIGQSADALRAALRAVDAAPAAVARLRVMPPRTGTALLAANLANLIGDTAVLVPHLAPPLRGLGAAEGGAMPLHLDRAATVRAIVALPAGLVDTPFPARAVVAGLDADAASLAILRVRAALDAAGAERLPHWDGTCEPASLPLLRALIGAAREGARPSASWIARLRAGLDTQWTQGSAPVMRLVDPADPAGTEGRLALAARGAALLGRHL